MCGGEKMRCLWSVSLNIDFLNCKSIKVLMRKLVLQLIFGCEALYYARQLYPSTLTHIPNVCCIKRAIAYDWCSEMCLILLFRLIVPCLNPYMWWIEANSFWFHKEKSKKRSNNNLSSCMWGWKTSIAINRCYKVDNSKRNKNNKLIGITIMAWMEQLLFDICIMS